MIPIADKKTKFKEFEWLKGVKDDVDKFRVNIFKFWYFRSLIHLQVIVLFVDADQRLIPFELFEKLMNWGVDDWDDVNYFLHDFILNKDVPLCFDNFDIQIVVLFTVINDRIFWMKFTTYFWYWIFDPDIVRINHWFYWLKIWLDEVIVFCIQFRETWFKRHYFNFIFFFALWRCGHHAFL